MNEENLDTIKISRFRGGDFVNRSDTLKQWKKFFIKWPNQVTFLYGPKSCGKTTLLEKVREQVAKNGRVTFFWYELREETFTDYQGVMNVLFPIAENSQSNIKHFAVTKKEWEHLKANELLPYQIINRHIEKETEAGKKVVIVIDELQSLKGIYIDTEKMLFKELLNYFVRLTKVEHKAQVILVTSNAYFIEEIFTDSQLEGSSEFIFLDYLNEIEVTKWLMKYQFTDNDIKYIWDRVGGYSWLLMQIIMKKKRQEDWKKLIEEAISQAKGKVITAVNHIETDKFKVEIIRFLKQLVNNDGVMNLGLGMFNRKILNFLIDNEIIFYDPVNARISVQFKPFYFAIKEALSDYKGKTEEADWFPD